MTFSRVALSLALPLFLAACGQSGTLSQPAAPTSAAPTFSIPSTDLPTTDSYPVRQAYLNSHFTAPEALTQPRVTDLTATQPGGKRISAQSLDKSVPIVLVHGFLGFGREGFGGMMKYWGGTLDVQEDLRAQGYTVFTAAVGPFSSNWDRAAELYAQIKGGCVDYGAVHSAQAQHDERDAAKCYPGFYPQWDAQHPVNLLGHSLGGPTSRMLVRLLDGGAPGQGDSLLFAGGHGGWVRSVMSVSSPSAGSPVADNLPVMLPLIKQTFLALTATLGASETGQSYNFGLGQFHLNQQPGENIAAYIDRVTTSGFFDQPDNALTEITPDGCLRFDAFVGRSAKVKYFSWATNDTSAGLFTGWAYPNVTMNPILNVAAYPYPRPLTPGAGNVFGKSAGGTVTYDASWWPNDGLVPTNYQDAPPSELTEKYSGQATLPGHWYALGRLEGYDHLDIIGLLTVRDVRPFYRNQAAFLSSQ